MIETSFDYEEYEKNRIARHKAAGLRFVPDGDGPKVYCVVCANASDWNEIHDYIINENEIDGIPNRKIECTNPQKTCKTLGSYMISDVEAEQLKTHPKVIGVNLDEEYYQGTYKGRNTFVMSEPPNKTPRYGVDVKISRDTSGSGHNSGSNSTWLRKTAAQIHRHENFDNAWKNSNDDTLITDDPEQFGDGTDVDLIVCDQAAWFGHIEFIKTGIGEPTNFVGTNVLKNGFATSATTGVCGVLDCVLDSPYYIDPDFFEADPSNRLVKRWDGTTVPVESVARAWWSTERANYVGHGFTIKITDASNSSNFKTFTITDNDGVVDYPELGYNRQLFDINDTPVASGGTLPSTGAVTVEFTRTGSGTFGEASYGPFSYNLTTPTSNPASGTINISPVTSGDDAIILHRVDSSGTDRSSVFNSSAPYNIDAVAAITNATRSAKFVGTDTFGGTATIGSDEDFGEITIPSTSPDIYTRAAMNGSNTALHTGYYKGALADHGTPCMSQAYGKTHGWAYNANKWYISIIWADGAIDPSILYKIHKVFHVLKPNRSSDNTKNPTVTSHSWGTTRQFFDGNYAYWRTNGDGTGEESITVTGSDPNYNVTSPAWLRNFWNDNNHVFWIRPSHATMQHGSTMLDSGVIFVGSAGNNNNQIVKGDHPNYNNYVSGSSSRTLSTAEDNSEMTNRVPNPLCIGNLPNYNGSGVDIYRTFAIGALNDNQVSNGDGSYYEYKVSYSNMGNAIDCWAIGDDSIGAQGGGSEYNFPRNDSTYRIDSNYNIVSSGGTLSLTSYDERFGGTSSACPVTAGLFATKLQYERDWIWSNLKTWLKDKVTNQSSNTEFLQMTEATTSSSSNWNTYYSLQGAERKILWDAPSSELTAKCELRGSNLLLTGTFTIS